MKLSTNTEWAAIAALIVYIAFTPGFDIVRQFLSSGLGKAVALGLVVYVWKYVSQPIAILLVVAVLRCTTMREGMKNPKAHCPAGYTLKDDNSCRDAKDNQGPPPTICLDDQDWDEKEGKCKPKSSAGIQPTALTTPPAEPPKMPEPPKTQEGFQPNQKDDKYAPA